MKYLLFCFLALTFSFSAHANDGRVESVALQIYDDLENERFEKVEEQLQAYTDKNIKTRHGTDIIIEIYEAIFEQISNEDSFEK